MDIHLVRRIISPVYAILVVVGFIISPTVGVAVAVVGGMLCGLMWATTGHMVNPPSGEGPRGDRATARAARRAGRR
jgi:hypothetical protein